MRCKGFYKNDRTCDLCKIVNSSVYDECYKPYKEKQDLLKRIRQTKECCPHLKVCYDHRDPFDACNKNGDAFGRSAPDCRWTEECEKMVNNYCSDKK